MPRFRSTGRSSLRITHAGDMIIKKRNLETREDVPVDEVAVHKNKKRKTIFPYGNYTRYYGYRVGDSLGADPRMKLMQKVWFENKDVLDIGCNEGHVTISLAQKYCLRSMCGIDIDPGLINMAQNNLQNESGLPWEETVEKFYDWSDYVHKKGGQVCDADNDEETRAEVLGEIETNTRKTDCGLQGKQLLEKVLFKNANFLHCQFRNNILDTVLCLSVVKWIHLNWGDDGLITFFSKIYSVLRPGGVLILEPQPWSSYAKKCRVSEICRQNFRKIIIRPEDFSVLLLDKIGFKTCEQITASVPDSKKGFSRPLFLYTK